MEILAMRHYLSKFRLRLSLSALLLTLSGGFAQVASAEGMDADLARRVAFVLNFSRYATWDGGLPIPPGGMFTICSWRGSGATKDLFEGIKGQTIAGHKVDYQIVDRQENLIRCNVLYVAEIASAAIDSLQSDIRTHRILLVTEVADKGSISLLKDGDTFTFSCDTKEAAASGIRLSSRMLKLAIEVR
jgi:hypothetical protein